MAKPQAVTTIAASALLLFSGFPLAAQQCYISTVSATQPVSFLAPHVVYDSARSRLVATDFWNTTFVRLYGWTGSSWTVLTPGGPSPRLNGAMAYDSVRDRVVVHGGLEGFTYQPAVWEWNGTAWSTFVGPPKFLGRAGHAMAYDAARQRTVVFGGERDGTYLNDVIQWDGTTWTTTAPSVRPSPRMRSALVYDSSRQRVVLIGGAASDGAVLADVWDWDGAAWTQRPSGPSLTPVRAAYIPSQGRVFVLGGPVTTGGQAWEFDGVSGSWSMVAQLEPGIGGNRPIAFDGLLSRVAIASGGGLTLWNPEASVVPLWISTQPQGGYCAPGFTAALSVGAGGTHIQYQWQRAGQPLVNGGNISGAQSAQLYFNPFTEANVGTYQVVISNVCRTLMSNTVALTLPPANPPCGSANCYANCDQSTGCPVLTANDFVCFINRFIAGESYANCDGVGGLVGGEDFICFLTRFNAGCS